MAVHAFERPAELWEVEDHPTYQNLARAVFEVEPDVVRVELEAGTGTGLDWCQVLIRTPGYRMPDTSRAAIQATMPPAFHAVFTGAITAT